MCTVSSGQNAAANPLAGPAWNGWGVTGANARYQNDAAGLTAASVPRLKLKWAFGFPGDIAADAQPTVAGGRVYVGSQSGNVYALDAASGCVRWFFQAAAPVRAARRRRLENGRPACPGGALCANRWPLAGPPTPGTPLHLTGTS